jgi:hypothetical protein
MTIFSRNPALNTPKKSNKNNYNVHNVHNAPVKNRYTNNTNNYDYDELPSRRLFNNDYTIQETLETPQKPYYRAYSANVINAPRKTRINNKSIDIEPRKLFVPKYNNNIRKEHNTSLLNAPKKGKRMDESNLELTPITLFTNEDVSSKNLIRPTKVRDNNQVLLMDNEGNAYIRVNLYDVFKRI